MGHIVLQMSVCPSVVDQIVDDHYLENYLSDSFHISMLIDLCEDDTPINLRFTLSKVKITRVT